MDNRTFSPLEIMQQSTEFEQYSPNWERSSGSPWTQKTFGSKRLL
ncbi:5313_t:CDS:2, partial [Funneliformis geosporum]